VKIVAQESKGKEFSDRLAKLKFLQDCLRSYRAIMTEDATSEIGYRKCFQDLLGPTEVPRSTTVVVPYIPDPESQKKVINVVDEVAHMVLASVINDGVVTFSCTEERDFVNMGICFLERLKYLSVSSSYN
jgi:hypothetical protein